MLDNINSLENLCADAEKDLGRHELLTSLAHVGWADCVYLEGIFREKLNKLQEERDKRKERVNELEEMLLNSQDDFDNFIENNRGARNV